MSDEYLKEMQEIYERSLNQGRDKKKFSRVTCPHTYDTATTKNSCVLCDLCKETIWDRSKPKDDPIKLMARKYSFKKKYYSNILFASKPDEIIILEYGDKIFNKLIAAQMDKISEWKNFMHPTQGRNLYITKVKIGPETKDVDYNVEPRMSTSALPNIQILTKLINLDNVIAEIESGRIIPVPQSKFEFSKTEVRVLPSGDKMKPLKFFKMVFWHENLTKEEFEAIMAGKYNPIVGLYTAPAEVVRPQTKLVKPESKVVTNEDLLADWGLNESEVKEEEPIQEGIEAEGGEESDVDTSVEPICFGQYDKANTVCNGKCQGSGWGESCKKLFEEKLAIRNRAKRLSK